MWPLPATLYKGYRPPTLFPPQAVLLLEMLRSLDWFISVWSERCSGSYSYPWFVDLKRFAFLLFAVTDYAVLTLFKHQVVITALFVRQKKGSEADHPLNWCSTNELPSTNSAFVVKFAGEDSWHRLLLVSVPARCDALPSLRVGAVSLQTLFL